MWVECMNCGNEWDDEEETKCPACGSTDYAPAVHEDGDLDDEEEGK